LKNPLKEKLNRGEAVIGTFIEIGHPDVTEWLSRLGFDWLLLDNEHAPTGYETLQRMMQSMNGSGCVPIVRPQWNDPVVMKRVLDIGGSGECGEVLQIPAPGYTGVWPETRRHVRPGLLQDGQR